jgi:hypothetical protein
MDLSELLQWVANGGKTGVLALERDRLTKKIGFREGKIVHVESNDPAEHIGQFLLAYGKIDVETLKRAFATQEKVGLRLGEILVQVNLVRQKDLDDMLRIQAVEMIYNLFLWEDGSFRFDDLTIPRGDEGLELDPSGIIMEGVYRFDEWKRYHEVFPTDDMTVKAEPAWNPATDEEKLLADLIRQGKTVGEICYEFRTSKFHTYSQLYELFQRRAISIERIGDVVPSPAASGKRLDDLYGEALTAVRDRRFDDALPLLESVLRFAAKEPGGDQLLEKADQTYRDILLSRYIDPHKVPRVNLPPALLTEKKFNPAEGYLISRIDGSWDVASIIRISPIPESEALGIFKKFIDENIIVLT